MMKCAGSRVSQDRTNHRKRLVSFLSRPHSQTGERNSSQRKEKGRCCTWRSGGTMTICPRADMRKWHENKWQRRTVARLDFHWVLSSQSVHTSDQMSHSRLLNPCHSLICHEFKRLLESHSVLKYCAFINRTEKNWNAFLLFSLVV